MSVFSIYIYVWGEIFEFIFHSVELYSFAFIIFTITNKKNADTLVKKTTR